jgi:DNA-binding response OmpR family regulator
MSEIVVIEEDGAMRMLISEWLAGEGHKVRSLTRPGAAPDDTVDLVILDLPQPRSRDGETTRVVIAVHAAYPHAAIIAISTQLGRSLESDSVVARALGVDRLLAKPCSREELLHAVAAAL